MTERSASPVGIPGSVEDRERYFSVVLWEREKPEAARFSIISQPDFTSLQRSGQLPFLCIHRWKLTIYDNDTDVMMILLRDALAWSLNFAMLRVRSVEKFSIKWGLGPVWPCKITSSLWLWDCLLSIISYLELSFQSSCEEIDSVDRLSLCRL